MKGPVIFLVTLVLVAAAAALVVLPAMQARSDAVIRLLEAPAAGQPDRAAEQRLAAGADRLAAALGLRAGEGVTSGVTRKLEHLAEELEVTPENTPEADLAALRLPWDRLPEFLTRLSEFAGPVLAGVRAEPTEDLEICRVQVRFALPGTPLDSR